MSSKKNKEPLSQCGRQNVVSGTEQTGLMPTPPMNENENNSYNELYQMPGRDKPQNKKNR